MWFEITDFKKPWVENWLFSHLDKMQEFINENSPDELPVQDVLLELVRNFFTEVEGIPCIVKEGKCFVYIPDKDVVFLVLKA